LVVAGRFYDDEAQRDKRSDRTWRAVMPSWCVTDRAVCFRRACFTLMAVSIGAAGFAGVLWYHADSGILHGVAY